MLQMGDAPFISGPITALKRDVSLESVLNKENELRKQRFIETDAEARQNSSRLSKEFNQD